jgi:hypothetical protein
MLRSTTPKRATRWLVTSVEHLLSSLADINPVAECSRDALSVQGPLWSCERIPPIVWLPKPSSFHDRLMTLRRTAPPG